MTINEFQFGRMVIDGKTYTSDLIVFPDRVSDSWWRQEGHKLWPDDLKLVLEQRPRHIIVGTGVQGLMIVTNAALERLAELDIEVIAEPTTNAWKTYNRLAGPTVVGAFHLTC